jgi:hypothetical protein
LHRAYQEYLSLNAKLTELEKNAYHDPKGYTLYSPELTEAIYILTSAINVRELLLADLAINQVKSPDSYYSEDLNSARNKFVDAQNKDIIQPRERFEVYDQGQIINTLNNLPIPDYYFYGLKLFFVNAQSNNMFGITLSNDSANNSIILVFNQPSMDKDLLIKTLVHEIGHIVEKKILYEYRKDDYGFLVRQENKQALLEYAKIYNKSEYFTEYDIVNKGEWAEYLSENFAEDFANIYLGTPKKTSWQGNHKSQVKAFIEEKITSQNTPRVPLLKNAKVISGKNVSDLGLRNTIPCIFYTKYPTVQIQVESLIGKDMPIEAQIYTEHYHTTAVIDAANQINLQFLKKGKYSIYLTASDPSLGKTVYFGFWVVYDP